MSPNPAASGNGGIPSWFYAKRGCPAVPEQRWLRLKAEGLFYYETDINSSCAFGACAGAWIQAGPPQRRSGRTTSMARHRATRYRRSSRAKRRCRWARPPEAARGHADFLHVSALWQDDFRWRGRLGEHG